LLFISEKKYLFIIEEQNKAKSLNIFFNTFFRNYISRCFGIFTIKHETAGDMIDFVIVFRSSYFYYYFFAFINMRGEFLLLNNGKESKDEENN
jgi:hypothetical protein